MNIDEVRRMRADIQAEIDAKGREIESLRLELAGVDALLTRLARQGATRTAADPALELNPAIFSGLSTEGIAAGIAAILLFYGVLRVADLVKEARSRGVAEEPEQVRSALGYLRRKNLVENPERGVWKWAAAEDVASPRAESYAHWLSMPQTHTIAAQVNDEFERATATS